MSDPSVSREGLIKPSRSKPVRGGKQTCAHCDEQRASSSAFCAYHRNEWQKQYAKDRRAELRALRERNGG